MTASLPGDRITSSTTLPDRRSILRWSAPALATSFVKLDPRDQWRNPVMFVVYVGSILTTLLWIQALAAGRAKRRPASSSRSTLWLWFTVLFANFAEAIAEGRSKAQAAALRGAARDIIAKKLARAAQNGAVLRPPVPSTSSRRGDVVLVEAGDFIPARRRGDRRRRLGRRERRSPANRRR